VILIVIGVSGAGKTTVGKLLARKLGWHFLEADDFHPEANVEKMRSGHPLKDKDRWPWLEPLREQIERSVAAGENGVLAYSALKRKYRDVLRVNSDVKFIFLCGDYGRIADQLHHRHGHFMNLALLHSQFADLEEPTADEGAITMELGRTPQKLAEEIKAIAELRVLLEETEKKRV
jgi:carbohydrate kinase (thermoresistant glucokinase family)